MEENCFVMRSEHMCKRVAKKEKKKEKCHSFFAQLSNYCTSLFNTSNGIFYSGSKAMVHPLGTCNKNAKKSAMEVFLRRPLTTSGRISVMTKGKSVNYKRQTKPACSCLSRISLGFTSFMAINLLGIFIMFI